MFRILVAVFATLVAGSHAALAATQILRANGEISVSMDRENWRPIDKSTLLIGGHWIKTAKNSIIDLRFDDDSLLRIKENSLVRLDKIEMSDAVEIQIDAKEGGICAVAADFQGASKFEVKTLAGVTGVRERNVEFAVDARGDFQCHKGTLVAVYVVTGIAPILVLKDHEIVLVNEFNDKWNKPGSSQTVIRPPTEKELKTIEENIAGLKMSDSEKRH